MSATTANLPDDFNVSERLVRDAGWLLQNAPAEIITEVEAERMTIHKAMRLCGRRVQGDRNLEFKRSVLRLCEHVLNEDLAVARRCAAEIVLKLAGKSADVC